MKYLNEKDLRLIGVNWKGTVDVIDDAVRCLCEGDTAQPIKPYLRYGNLKNRIIAMPAFIGGKFNISGIKWIASFPDNIQKAIPRAHSVVVLNDADTGQPVAIINTPLLSIIRTASVSGLMMKYWDRERKLEKFVLGIVGWGPIGQHHLKMFLDIYGDRISKIYIYDKRPVINRNDIIYSDREKIIIVDSWKQAYESADVFVTCTVSDERYIDKKPKDGSLQLNVSLRDYKLDIFEYVKNSIIVDDWGEVCRENTDIEFMHNEKGLNEDVVKTIQDVVCRDYLKTIGKDQIVMFNPMGMGIFDIAIGKYYLDKSNEENQGKILE